MFYETDSIPWNILGYGYFHIPTEYLSTFSWWVLLVYCQVPYQLQADEIGSILFIVTTI